MIADAEERAYAPRARCATPGDIAAMAGNHYERRPGSRAPYE